ncbi:MAG TPA: sulfatase-like hydrolase/transferase, partial [Vicinamibacteria bacterium]
GDDRSPMRLGRLLLVLLALSSCSTRPQHRNVILVSVDTLRADHLSCYGSGKVETPNFDRIAREGVLFERVSTVAPSTLPAHASMLTGLGPLGHGVHDNVGFHLREDVPTLASVLKGAGYRTGGFVGSFALSGRFGIGRGFDLYSEGAPKTGGRWIPERRGEEVLGEALAWMELESDRPFFAFIHFYDPHRPYQPPAAFLPPDARPEDESARYAGEIRYVDSLVGKLLAWLDARGLSEDTILVVTADHGESLGEHGEDTHGFFLYESTLRVPLLLRAKPLPAGKRVEHLVRLIDIAPTIWELSGTAPPPGVEGVSLASAGGELPPLDLDAYSETFVPRLNYGWSELQGWRRGNFKLIQAPRSELYDVDADPGETRNLIDERPEVADALRNGLDEAKRGKAVEPGPVDERTLSSLRALGYLGGSPQAHAAGERTDPKDRIETYNAILALSVVQSPTPEDLARIESVLEREPRNPRANSIHGSFLLALGRPKEAKKAYERLLEIEPESFDGHYGLGRTFLSLEENDEARASLEKARSLDPESTSVLASLAAVEKAEGNLAASEKLLREAMALGPTDTVYRELADLLLSSGRADELASLASSWDGPEAAFARGQALAAQGNDEGALVELDRALALAPHDDNVEQAVANSLSRVGRFDEAMKHYQAILSRTPCYLGAHTNLGAILEKRGNADEGIGHYERAIACDPQYGSAYRNLGAALARKGELRRALETLRKAKALSPGDKELDAAIAELESLTR